ncbi:MAG: GNAT family N-acetyltransferase [Burkholderiales bacterium]|nr:GNAT family N-acetyltransferase [Burkholderiales bacterium]
MDTSNTAADTIALRSLRPDEMDWANARYAEIGFLPSSPLQNIVVAEVDGADGTRLRAGLGRLVPVSGDNVSVDDCAEAELSGIYVLPEYRGRGIADRIVTELVRRSRHSLLYCIPFKSLESFYMRFGFERRERGDDLPCAIQKKLGWCDARREEPVGLLIRRRT